MLLPAALFAAQTRYARLGEFDGPVEVQLRAPDAWMGAERNLPLIEGTWLRTGTGGRVEVELDEGSAWRLGANSQASISDYARLSTGQRVTLLSLDRGVAYFTGQPEGKDSLVLSVPGAQVILTRGSRVRLEVEEAWSQIAVIEGMVRFSSPAAELDLREGQVTRVEPSNPARFFLYKEITPLESDRWSEGRDKAMASNASAAHVVERYGLVDLDGAGEWIQTEDAGTVWHPKMPAGWTPYQKGRWRWYDTLGYTWVSDDEWGWLPYHHGRWWQREKLGWVWVPAKNTVFKPGEVYWMRGARLAGWGPLAPGEEYHLPGADGAPPLQFLNANTTFAAWQTDLWTIDPAGFSQRPKEPLVAAAFVMALPSPALVASRLDVVRPELRAGNARVNPSIDGVTFVSQPATPVVVEMPPPPPPVVIVQNPPPDPTSVPAPPPPAVLVPYPVAVYTGIVFNAPEHPTYSTPPKPAASAGGSGTKHETPKPTPGPGQRKPETPPAGAPVRVEKHFHAGEREIAGEVVGDVTRNDFTKALKDLDKWTERYHESEYQDDRQYYYVVAHNGLAHPAKVLESAMPLVSKGAEARLDDPRQLILALYLAVLNSEKISGATQQQRTVARGAARGLLDSVPKYFTPENRPSGTSMEDWTKARTDLEATARGTLRGSGTR